MNKTPPSLVQLMFFLLAVQTVMKLQHSFRNGAETPLSKKEMVEIKSKINKDYAPIKFSGSTELATITQLSAPELLEVSNNISLYYAPRILSGSKKLVLLAVDPQHLYAYWNLGDNKDYALSKAIANGEVVLRIYSKTDGIRGVVKRQQQAEITINELQSGKKISLFSYEKSADYSACIGKARSKKPFVPLLNANLSDTYQIRSKQKITKKNELDPADFKNFAYKEIQKNFRTADEVNQSLGSLKSHYASTNYSGKGMKK